MDDGVRILGIEDATSAAPAVSLAQLAEAARNDSHLRFTMELEFVESLANAEYLQFLAEQRLLDSPAFVAYLAYLQYWRTPAYIRFIQYPHALLFLELLLSPAFRRYIFSMLNGGNYDSRTARHGCARHFLWHMMHGPRHGCVHSRLQVH